MNVRDVVDLIPDGVIVMFIEEVPPGMITGGPRFTEPWTESLRMHECLRGGLKCSDRAEYYVVRITPGDVFVGRDSEAILKIQVRRPWFDENGREINPFKSEV